MAGMVGSRNGWVEAPYLHCPCGPRTLAARLTAVPGLGRDVLIVPGVDMRWADGSYDVMRGEETQVFGTGVDGRPRSACPARTANGSKCAAGA